MKVLLLKVDADHSGTSTATNLPFLLKQVAMLTLTAMLQSVGSPREFRFRSGVKVCKAQATLQKMILNQTKYGHSADYKAAIFNAPKIVKF